MPPLRESAPKDATVEQIDALMAEVTSLYAQNVIAVTRNVKIKSGGQVLNNKGETTLLYDKGKWLSPRKIAQAYVDEYAPIYEHSYKIKDARLNDILLNTPKEGLQNALNSLYDAHKESLKFQKEEAGTLQKEALELMKKNIAPYQDPAQALKPGDDEPTFMRYKKLTPEQIRTDPQYDFSKGFRIPAIERAPREPEPDKSTAIENAAREAVRGLAASGLKPTPEGAKGPGNLPLETALTAIFAKKGGATPS